jgi:hypothetical protein
MSSRGVVNRRICTNLKLQPSVSTKTDQTGLARQQTNNIGKSPLRVLAQTKLGVGLESASRLLIVLVIMTMQFGRINAFNEMCADFKVK